MNEREQEYDRVGSFSEFRTNRDEGSFTDWLRERSEPAWSRAVQHPFTRELSRDELDRDAFREYLVQDLDFVETLISAFGFLIGQTESMETKSHVSQFLASVTSDENDYFERALDALDVSPEQYRKPDRNSVNRDFQSFLMSAVQQNGVETTFAVLLPVEWVYNEWAKAVADAEPESFYFREWIELHNNPAFDRFVGHLRDRLDEIGPSLPPERQQKVAERFEETVQYEVEFFDAVHEEENGLQERNGASK